MKRSMFSEEQIIGILKEQEAGMPTAEVERWLGKTEQRAEWIFCLTAVKCAA